VRIWCLGPVLCGTDMRAEDARIVPGACGRSSTSGLSALLGQLAHPEQLHAGRYRCRSAAAVPSGSASDPAIQQRGNKLHVTLISSRAAVYWRVASSARSGRRTHGEGRSEPEAVILCAPGPPDGIDSSARYIHLAPVPANVQCWLSLGPTRPQYRAVGKCRPSHSAGEPVPLLAVVRASQVGKPADSPQSARYSVQDEAA
jgi:hypothetical protein